MADDVATVALNNALNKAVADAVKEKHATAGDLLAAQLTGIFKAIATLADTQNTDNFFKKYYADYFYQLAQSPHIPAFARLISQSTPESAAWIKANAQAMTALNEWVKATERIL